MQRNALHDIEIPFIPNYLDPAALDCSNGKLLGDAAIQGVKRICAGSYNVRISRRMLQTPYSVIFFGPTMFAIGPRLGKGGYGVVKLVQNLETGDWAAIKVRHSELGKAKEEHDNLVKVGEAIMTTDGKQPLSLVQQSLPARFHPKYYYLMKLHHGLPMDLLNFKTLPNIIWLEACLSTLQTVYALNSDNFMHGDIKLQNLIYDREANKSALVDWQSLIDKSESMDAIPQVTTRGYTAPEYYVGMYDSISEAYSSGVTIGLFINAIGHGMLIHPQFISFKEKIPDEKIRLQIVGCIESMLMRNSDNRLSLGKAICLFSNFIYQMPVKDRKVAIYVVSVNEIDEFILKMKKRNQGAEVALVDPDCSLEIKDYTSMKYKLDREGFFTRRKVLRGAPYSILFDSIKQETQPSDSFRINEYRSLQDSPNEHAASHDLTTLLEITDMLSHELRRLESKYMGKRSTVTTRARASHIVREIRELEAERQSNSTDPTEWPQRLKTLERQMQSTGFTSKIGSKLGLFSAITGKKNIKKIRLNHLVKYC